ncbi:MAG: glutathione S-transferase family protein [Pseudomonadota bacterium]
MELHGTARSHFTRKVRLLLDHIGLDYRLIDIGNVAAADAETFANNPLMSVPVLHDGDVHLIESDHIAAYLVRKYDPDDHYQVLTTRVERLNTRAVLNGAMAAEVRLVLADRTGLEIKHGVFFEKARAVISNALDWCEERAVLFSPDTPTYLDFHFISLWDHAHFYKLVQGEWQTLQEIAQRLSASELVQRSELTL